MAEDKPKKDKKERKDDKQSPDATIHSFTSPSSSHIQEDPLPLSIPTLSVDQDEQQQYSQYPLENCRSKFISHCASGDVSQLELAYSEYGLLGGSKLNLMNYTDSHGSTPVHIAVAMGRYGALQWLVEQGANVNSKNKDNESLLHVAVKQSAQEVIEYLCGCDGIEINITNFSGETPLHIAAKKGNIDIVKILVEVGRAFVKARDVNQIKPVDYAKDKNFESIVEYLEDQAQLEDIGGNGTLVLTHVRSQKLTWRTLRSTIQNNPFVATEIFPMQTDRTSITGIPGADRRFPLHEIIGNEGISHLSYELKQCHQALSMLHSALATTTAPDSVHFHVIGDREPETVEWIANVVRSYNDGSGSGFEDIQFEAAGGVDSRFMTFRDAEDNNRKTVFVVHDYHGATEFKNNANFLGSSNAVNIIVAPMMEIEEGSVGSQSIDSHRFHAAADFLPKYLYWLQFIFSAVPVSYGEEQVDATEENNDSFALVPIDNSPSLHGSESDRQLLLMSPSPLSPSPPPLPSPSLIGYDRSVTARDESLNHIQFNEEIVELGRSESLRIPLLMNDNAAPTSSPKKLVKVIPMLTVMNNFTSINTQRPNQSFGSGPTLSVQEIIFRQVNKLYKLEQNARKVQSSKTLDHDSSNPEILSFTWSLLRTLIKSSGSSVNSKSPKQVSSLTPIMIHVAEAMVSSKLPAFMTEVNWKNWLEGHVREFFQNNGTEGNDTNVNDIIVAITSKLCERYLVDSHAIHILPQAINGFKLLTNPSGLATAVLRDLLAWSQAKEAREKAAEAFREKQRMTEKEKKLQGKKSSLGQDDSLAKSGFISLRSIPPIVRRRNLHQKMLTGDTTISQTQKNLQEQQLLSQEEILRRLKEVDVDMKRSIIDNGGTTLATRLRRKLNAMTLKYCSCSSKEKGVIVGENPSATKNDSAMEMLQVLQRHHKSFPIPDLLCSMGMALNVPANSMNGINKEGTSNSTKNANGSRKNWTPRIRRKLQQRRVMMSTLAEGSSTSCWLMINAPNYSLYKYGLLTHRWSISESIEYHEVRRYFRLPAGESCAISSSKGRRSENRSSNFLPGYFLRIFVYMINTMNYKPEQAFADAGVFTKVVYLNESNESDEGCEVSIIISHLADLDRDAFVVSVATKPLGTETSSRVGGDPCVSSAFHELNLLRNFLYTGCWNMQYEEYALPIRPFPVEDLITVMSTLESASEEDQEETARILLRQVMIHDMEAVDELESRIFGIPQFSECVPELYCKNEVVNRETEAIRIHEDCLAARRNAAKLYFGKRVSSNYESETQLESSDGWLSDIVMEINISDIFQRYGEFTLPFSDDEMFEIVCGCSSKQEVAQRVQLISATDEIQQREILFRMLKLFFAQQHSLLKMNDNKGDKGKSKKTPNEEDDTFGLIDDDNKQCTITLTEFDDMIATASLTWANAVVHEPSVELMILEEQEGKIIPKDYHKPVVDVAEKEVSSSEGSGCVIS